MWASSFWFSIILIAAVQKISTDDCKNQTFCPCKPVFLFHGALEDSNFMRPIEERIKKINPCTVIFNSNAYPGLATLTPLWDQINGKLGQQFREFCKKYPGGIIAIGHSQEALLLRALIEIFCNHCVHTFISIAGPQAGQYGLSAYLAPLVPLLQQPLTLDAVTDFYYQNESQYSISGANYWNDPTLHSEYLKRNIFLPVINNEVRSNSSSYYKKCFLKLKKLVTIGGPQDAVIIPWQSSEFSFFNASKTVISYKYREIYTKDLFGLKTLDEDGRWIRYDRSGIEHFEFLTDKGVFEDFIRPHLDCTETKVP